MSGYSHSTRAGDQVRCVWVLLPTMSGYSHSTQFDSNVKENVQVIAHYVGLFSFNALSAVENASSLALLPTMSGYSHSTKWWTATCRGELRLLPTMSGYSHSTPCLGALILCGLRSRFAAQNYFFCFFSCFIC